MFSFKFLDFTIYNSKEEKNIDKLISDTTSLWTALNEIATTNFCPEIETAIGDLNKVFRGLKQYKTRIESQE